MVRRERGADDPVGFTAHPDDDADVNALVSDPDAWFVTSADSDLDDAMAPGTHTGTAVTHHGARA